MSCDNNKINAFEVCTINAINYLNNNNHDYIKNNINNDKRPHLFDHNFSNLNFNLNSNIRDPKTNAFIYTYDKNKKDLCYNYNNNQDEYMINCSILYDSPFYTYNKKTNKCEFIPNFELPNNFSYIVEGNNISIYNNIQKDENYYKFKYEKNIQQAYCENKWYDWITIPNYHFGNRYEKDTGEYSKLDVKKCYKPCPLNHIPYVKEDKSRICVNKTDGLNGLIQNKLDYSPISLINLIGNTKETLCLLYQNIYSNNIKNFEDDINNNYIPNTTYTGSKINNNQNFFNSNNIEIISAYNDMSIAVNNILNKSQTIDNENFNKYENYKDIITYKNPNFNEDNDPDMLTLNSLNNSKMLTDDILIHTFYLAYYYHQFITIDIFKYDNYLNVDKTFNIENINNHKFNLTTNVKNLLFNINDNDNNKRKAIHRLTNILYKAISVCYDNKSDFSINLIILTKDALKKNINTHLYDKLLKNINDKDNTDNYILNKITYFNYDIYDKFGNQNPIFNQINTGSASGMYIDNKEKILKNIIDKHIILYGEEYNETKGKCSPNQFYDTNQKKCVNCGDCKGKCDKLVCKNMCPNVCPSSSLNNKQQPHCGIKYKNKEKPDKKIEFETPVDMEDDKNIFSDLSRLIKIIVKIVFAIIFLYICYMFYDIFGEAMLSFINILYYSVLKIGLLFMNIFSYINGMLGYENSYNANETEKIRSDYVYENTKDKLSRLIDKSNQIEKIIK